MIMATYLDYARRDGDRPERWPNLREAASKPYMGQTAVIGRRPWLVVGFDGEFYELENEFGDRMRSNKFEVLEYESDNNRLVAASRVDGSPLDVGMRLASCDCAVGLLDFNRDSYEWSVLTDEGNVVDVEARISELEDADWKVAETLKEAVGYDPGNGIPDMHAHEYYCPECGSNEVDFGDDIAYCENCGWHGHQNEILTDHDVAYDRAEVAPDKHYDDSDWQYEQYASVKEADPADYSGKDDPGSPPHIKGAPTKVNEIYNACMREGNGRGDTLEDKKASCAAIAWSTYKKEKKSRTFGADPGTREAKIVQENGQFCVKSEDGNKNLGCYDSKDGAVKRLREVEYFKHQGALALDDLGIEKEGTLDEEQLPDLNITQRRQLAQEIHRVESGQDSPTPILDRVSQAMSKPIRGEGTITVASMLGIIAQHYGLLGFLGLGKTADGYDSGGISDRADSMSDPLKCPQCGSHTVGLLNSDKMEFGCKACGKRFKHDVEINPKGKGKKGSIELVMDSDGRPVASGQYYNLHGDKYKIPDVIKILEIKDGHIVATVDQNPTPLKISAEDIKTNGYSFEPLPITSHIEQHDLREEIHVAPVNEGVIAQVVADVEDQDKVGNEYTLPTPSGGMLWIRENASGAVTAWSLPSFDGQPGLWSTRNLDKVQAQVDTARTASLAKTAGKNYSPSEQKTLIEEKGHARNKDKLRLDDSHYVESSIEDDLDFLF